MKVCAQCQNEMIDNNKVTVEGGVYRIKISRKGRGFFGKKSAKPKASICPKCGYVALYIDEYRQFTE